MIVILLLLSLLLLLPLDGSGGGNNKQCIYQPHTRISGIHLLYTILRKHPFSFLLWKDIFLEILVMSLGYLRYMVSMAINTESM